MSKNKTKAPLMPVETLAEEARIPTWELAALRQAARWADGKQVTQGEFDIALENLRNRPQGGGTI
jgi:hypothetical protein